MNYHLMIRNNYYITKTYKEFTKRLENAVNMKGKHIK